MRVTLRFQSTGVVPGNAQPIVMRGGSLTIGRGDQNDLVLADSDRLISKVHCTIEQGNSQVSVIDFSTNGTFLNYGKTALGRVPSPLHDGDILTMGPYEFLVEVSTDQMSAGIPAPLDDGPVSHGKAADGMAGLSVLDTPDISGGLDFLDDLLGSGGPGGPSTVQRAMLGDDGLLPPLGSDDDLLAPPMYPDRMDASSQLSHSPAVEDHFTPPSRAMSAIPDDWDDFLETASPATAPTGGTSDDGLIAESADPASNADRPPGGVPVRQAADQESAFNALGAVLITPVAADVVPPRAAQVMGDETAARAFLAALGADHLGISSAELAPTMSRLGHVLRIMVQGLREVLMTRSSIKSEFRMQQTMISADGNNPLKFSVSSEQAVEALVKPASTGYLSPVKAAEQALHDVKAHEAAMMTGMEAALKGILKRLDPAMLEGKIETSGGFGSILRGKQARYWEVYVKMYAEISDQAENDFHELFSKEFARAYQDQLERLK